MWQGRGDVVHASIEKRVVGLQRKGFLVNTTSVID